MGDEITSRFFEGEDFSRFRELLDEETALLEQVFKDQGFSSRGDVAGFELEAWLVDNEGTPRPDNQIFLEQLASPLVVPELARFNIEINGSPSALTGRVFTRLHDELSATWQHCRNTAAAQSLQVVAIGTMPSATPDLFVAGNMSEMMRYKSLNDRVMALRDGRALEIELDGNSPLSLTHSDVMLEAAATSFQIHLQCRADRATQDFNASLATTAPLVAVSANAPYLFGHEVWDESRIPLFEQSVDVGERNDPRVFFGSGYVKESIFEIFAENCRQLILIPMVHDSPVHEFRHVRFQNGTLWRWVRPLIGFDFDGQVHLRIEQRVPSAGPTIVDCIANAAFYYGMVSGLREQAGDITDLLPFDLAKQNFYAAARYGLGARVVWPKGSTLGEWAMRDLIIEELMPLARHGLTSLGIPDSEVDEYLDVIAARADNSQNGAAWQRRFVSQTNATMTDLVTRYRELQQTDQPVHTWPL